MKLSEKFELIGCENNLIIVSISIDTEVPKDIIDTIPKIKEIKKIILPVDKKQLSLEGFSTKEKLKYDFEEQAKQYAKKHFSEIKVQNLVLNEKKGLQEL